MSTRSLPVDDPLSTNALARIIAACDQFEADWKAGRPRRIEDELGAADEPIRTRLFGELLALELELTRRDGRFAEPDAYIARFPDKAGTVRELFAGHTVAAPNGKPSCLDANEVPTSSPEGYELLRVLGKGGQATTYLARDRALQRLVVLKCYHGVASAGRREAVLNEGRALARVRSRFVATCYGVKSLGEEIDLVMEYVPGRLLTELTADERADIRRCVRLVEQVAEGLAEVHACGLLHRDIKPQNIILGDNGVPRLVDFGLALPVASEALEAVAGSPPYMAPEQARGQSERIDARTDIYGLGAVLYYLLTGQPPHEGKTLDAILEHARSVPIVSPRRINPQVPRALGQICLKSMAADPQSRYQSADALRRALGRHLLMRGAAPVLGAVVVLLVLLVPARTFWSKAARQLTDGQGRSLIDESTNEPQSEPKQTPAAGLRVTRFEIPHYPKYDAKNYDKRRVGMLGRNSFTAREDDDVTVQAELSEPAYSFLIAFRPDGTDQLCDPDDEESAPSRKQRPQYPPITKGDDRYRLSEGAGLHAFALVVSRKPLPPYREWKKQNGVMPWAAKLPSEPGVVWRDDNQGPEPLQADDHHGTRGKGAPARDASGPVATLAKWLRDLPGVDAVTLEAFAVEPASGP